MPDLKCPFCGAQPLEHSTKHWACGTPRDSKPPSGPRSTHCQLNAAKTRLDDFAALAAEQCGHSPESTQDPLEAIRRELARLRERVAAWRQWRRTIPPADYPPCPGEARLQDRCDQTSPEGG